MKCGSSNFFDISTTVDGKRFVTAREWDDLGRMIDLYEKNKIKVDYGLVLQYLQDKKIAADFANYYDLYNTYKKDYRIGDILEGKADDSLYEEPESVGCAFLRERKNFLKSHFGPSSLLRKNSNANGPKGSDKDAQKGPRRGSRQLKKNAKVASGALSNTINFCDKAFNEQELSIFIVELTANGDCAEFLGKYGCPEYFAHNKSLLIYEHGLDVIARLE